MKYRVKVGNMYFARFEDAAVVMIVDDSPGALEQAKLFLWHNVAFDLARVIGGKVEPVEEEPTC